MLLPSDTTWGWRHFRQAVAFELKVRPCPVAMLARQRAQQARVRPRRECHERYRDVNDRTDPADGARDARCLGPEL